MPALPFRGLVVRRKDKSSRFPFGAISISMTPKICDAAFGRRTPRHLWRGVVVRSRVNAMLKVHAARRTEGAARRPANAWRAN